MKKQIVRFIPHQNAKVSAVLMAISSLFMFVPFFLVSAFTMPDTTPDGHPANFPYVMLLIMPILYLVFTYVFVVIGCVIYNWLAKRIGGFEFQASNP